MNEFIIAEVDTYMGYTASVGIKKYQVPFLQFRCGNLAADRVLFPGKAWKGNQEAGVRCYYIPGCRFLLFLCCLAIYGVETEILLYLFFCIGQLIFCQALVPIWEYHFSSVK